MKRSEQKIATRQRVIETAKAHLERKGYRDTNIRGIAKDAGCSPGTVLLHFQDKADILHTALFDDLQAVWDRAKSRPARDVQSDAEAIFSDLYGYYADRPKLTRELLRESMFAEEPWKERFGAQVSDVMRRLTESAVRDQQAGKLDPRANPQMIAASCLSFYYFALIGWVQGGVPEPMPFLKMMLDPYLANLKVNHE